VVSGGESETESGVGDSEVDESGVGESEDNEAGIDESVVDESVVGAGVGESEVDGVTESSEVEVEVDEVGDGFDGGDGDVEYGARLMMAA
jgi:hypothetical protein